MANTNAFIRTLTGGNGQDESGLINQSSPTWVLSFVRWEQRDTLRTEPSGNVNFTTTRQTPLVVENDCIQVSVVGNKNTLTPSMNATLVMTDVNYETEIAPGDFCFVNMLNWEVDARRVADQARANNPINGLNDGFKGVFKVQSVRKVLNIDPQTGVKIYLFKITGFAFTEFNQTVYFNQGLLDQSEQQNLLLFASNIGSNWALMVANKGLTNVQDLIRALIESFIGNGIGDQGKEVKGIVKSPNTLFFIPALVGQLLNVENAKAAKDVYNYLFGIQDYNANSNQTLEEGMNPTNNSDGRFFFCTRKCQGDTVHKPEYWDQVQMWSILNQFTNAPLNELFTSFKISPDGDVMPTVVFRQIPFTNDDFNAGQTPVTRYMNIPRWKIGPGMVFGFDLGRDEAARINFVQYFGRSTFGPGGWSISAETAAKNYLYDIDDVQRSGLRPYIISTLFDEPVDGIEQKLAFQSPFWAKILGDALIGGQLKFNGTMETMGIVDPIAVGDNLQFDGVVYHIEQIAHSCSISTSDGKKIFRTTLSLSHGLSIDSSAEGVRYAEMTYADAYKLRQVDYKGNQILPGVSESQDVVYRPITPDSPRSTATGFPQPNVSTSINSPQRNPADGESDTT